jgi:predicted dehydrogenase
VQAVLIGCGDHGGGILIPACLSAGIRLTCLVDRNTDRARALAGQWNIPRVHASVDELDAGSGVDAEAAIVALPPTEQAHHAAWALSGGLHVFIEKPPALDPGELQALVSHARTAGRACCVGMNFRSADGMRALIGRLRSGRHGQVSFARITQVARKPIAPFHERTSFEASLFYAQGIHALDLALMLVPGPQSVSGQFLNVKRGLFCTVTGENVSAGSRFETSFGSCGAGLYHEVNVLSESGDLLSLRNLSELICHPNGGEPSIGEYPGARVLWRRSPVDVGYASAGYATELAAFRQRITGGQPGAPDCVAELDQLVPVYDAFDSLLRARGLQWMT